MSRVVLTIKDLWRESLACGKYVVHDGEIRRTSIMNISRYTRFCCKFCLYTEYVYFYVIQLLNKRYRIPKGQSKIDNPKKLAALGTQDK